MGHPAALVAGAAGAGSPGLAAAAAMLADPDRLLARLVEIVAARTGYPTDMLDPDLDVEADLSIDSIKRMEILAELADEIGLSDDGNLDQLEDLVEDLAKNKTLRSIVGFLVGHADRLTGGAAAGGLPAAPVPEAPAPAVDVAPAASSANGNGHGPPTDAARAATTPWSRPPRGRRPPPYGSARAASPADLGRQHRHDQRHGTDPALLLPLHDRREGAAGADPRPGPPARSR